MARADSRAATLGSKSDTGQGKPYFSGTLPDRIVTTYSDGSTSTYTVPDNPPPLNFTEVPVANTTPELTPTPTVTEETGPTQLPDCAQGSW
jgi:hypothetical protein